MAARTRPAPSHEDTRLVAYGTSRTRHAFARTGYFYPLYLLPPLVGADEHLSSTKLRDALANGAAGGDATLAAHGYASAAALGALLGANGGAGALAELEGAARARGEWEAGSAG